MNPNRLLCLAACSLGMVGAVVQAQSLALADPTPWSDFPRAAAPAPDALQGLAVHETFRAIVQEGPWRADHRSVQTAAEQRWMADLQAGRWAQALATLKSDHGMRLGVPDASGATGLGLAARAGQLDLVRELIRQGAPLDTPALHGLTPLAAAAAEGHDLVVHDLLRAGAQVNARTDQGQTPLHMAAAAGRSRTIALLLRHGAAPQALNKEGRMPLHQAAYRGHVQALQALVQAGQPLAVPDAHGLNAVHAAALGNQPDTVAWLRGQGVPVPSLLSQVLIDQMGACPPGLPACVQALP